MKTTVILDAPTLFRKAFNSFLGKLLIQSKNYELESIYQLENLLLKHSIDYLFVDPKHFNEIIFNKLVQYKKEKYIKKIIIITLQNDFLVKHDCIKTVEKTVDGLLTKECSELQITELFYYLDKGERFFPIYLNPSKKQNVNLTNQEHTILKMLADGNTCEFITNKLCISIHTYRTHRKNIMKKLNAHNTTDLLLYALNNQI